ncbi:putative ammonium permease ATO3 Ecym_2321 [Eremothecium cymbalariae DBVPG|uniref:Uncharacterized protein n=1 Tax=Eremothecium cymbalariae (strain CBS 270.75 / DBVPG 7215 / KCTC 17166 / NRRL Y-17582) TaxID=931890 RepID=G8JQ61_ERECY|nr:Hypothetical protein Ecym_2321 [Eremothecium cymbalariae DBVPG\
MNTASDNSSHDLEKGVALCAEGSSKMEPSVQEVGTVGEYVYLGNTMYRKADLASAFSGFGSGTAQIKNEGTGYANPVPLGLAAFSYSCMLLSLYNMQVRGVTNNHILVGVSFFLGGMIEVLAGLLCFVTGNTYGMVVFSIFGAFWFCEGAIITDAFGVIQSFGDDTKMLNDALGLFLIVWVIFTFFMFLCTLKSPWGLFGLLFFLDITFLLLSIASFTGNENVTKAGGWTGLISSFFGWYSLYATFSNSSNSYIPLPMLMMPNAS